MPYADPKQRALRRREIRIENAADQLAEPFIAMLTGDGNPGNTAVRKFAVECQKLLQAKVPKDIVAAAIYDLFHSLPDRSAHWKAVMSAALKDESAREALVAVALNIPRHVVDVRPHLTKQMRTFARQQAWTETFLRVGRLMSMRELRHSKAADTTE